MTTLTIEVRGTRLWVMDGNRDSGPAGMRLMRGGHFPLDRFEFATPEEAEAARRKLQAYLDERDTTRR